MWAWLKGNASDKKPSADAPAEAAPMRTYRPQAARQHDGARAEALAQQFLIEKGLKAVHANLACTQGEIDLIMLDGRTLVFVEVRWRKTAAFGGALASVTPQKVAKLMRACEVFLQTEQKWRAHPCRVDVVALQGALDAPSIEWVQNISA